MDNTQYINYGDQQIDLQLLLKNMANDVQQYVASRPWTNKRKLLFLDAYTDLVTRGIKGASNTTGLWMIDVGGKDLELESKSKKSQDMYHAAAYFIQLQMSRIVPETVEETKEKKELPAFTNDQFFSDLTELINNNEFGGMDPESAGTRWNLLDTKRDENGKLSREVRAERLSTYLQQYINSLSEDKYNFAEGPYGSLDNFKTRANEVIRVLGTPDESDDLSALNKLGLKESDWFAYGLNDPSGFTLGDKELTAGEYAKINKYKTYNLKDGIQKKEVSNLKITEFFPGIRTMAEQSIKQSKINTYDLGTVLEKMKLLGNFDEHDLQTISWMLSNSDLEDLSEQELKELPAEYLNGTLKKISGINGLYYNLDTNTLIQSPITKLIDSGVTNPRFSQTLNTWNQLLTPKTPEPESEDKAEADLVLKENPEYKLKDNFTFADGARIVSALGDVVSLGGTAANITGGAVSIASDLAADISEGDWGGAAGNLLTNAGWTVLGLIPGTKAGKVARSIKAVLPGIWYLMSTYNLLTGSYLSTFKKLKNGDFSDLTNQDLENLTYLIRVATGFANIQRSKATEKNYRAAEGTRTYGFETQSGKTIHLSDAEIAEINKLGIKRGLKAYKNKFQELSEGELPAENLANFSEKGHRGLFANTRSKWISGDEKLKPNKSKSNILYRRTPELLQLYDELFANTRVGSIWKPSEWWWGWRPFGKVNSRSNFNKYFGVEGNQVKLVVPPNAPAREPLALPAPKSKLTGSPESAYMPKGQITVPSTLAAKKLSSTPIKSRLKLNHTTDKNLLNSVKLGLFTGRVPQSHKLEFKDALGKSHTWELTLKNNEFILTQSTPSGKTTTNFGKDILNLKSTIYENLSRTFNLNEDEAKKNLRLPAYIVRKLLGTAYGWLKQGGQINNKFNNVIKLRQ